MRTFVPENVLKYIIRSTLTVFGNDHILPSECKLLAEDIYIKTQKTISETTLKRLLGFAKRDFHFSVYTLEALAAYSGYEAWDAFYTHASPEIIADEKDDAWQKLKKISKAYSLNTMLAIGHSAGAASNIIDRHDFTHFIHTFINSNKSIAPVIAPTGFGKSISLFRTASTLWLGDNPLFPNDICCFINVHQLINIAFNHNSFSEWLMQYSSVDEKVNSFDIAHTKDYKLVFIIDGIDDRSLSHDKQKIVFANIAEFATMTARYGYVKMILGMRPYSWKKLKASYGNTDFFNEQVFIDGSYPSEEYVNHTLFFSNTEIGTILNQHGIDNETLDQCSEQFKSFLSYPENMRLFYGSKYIHSLKNTLESAIIYEITNAFIKNHFNFNTSILKNIFENIIRAKLSSPSNSINENDISLNYASGITYYIQLFDNNLLQEDNFYAQNVFPFTRIKFVNDTIEEYFIAYYALTENNLNVDKKLIDFIFDLTISREMKNGILRWIIIDIIHKDKLDELDYIFNYGEITQLEKISLFEFILSVNADQALLAGAARALCEKNQLIAIFLSQIELGFYFSQREAFIKQLLDFTTDSFQTKALLQLLFTRSLSELKITQAETYLQYYRTAQEADNDLLTDLLEQIMSIALDFSSRNIKVANIEQLAKNFIETIAIIDTDQYTSIYSTFLLLTHYAVFKCDHVLLEKVTTEIIDIFPASTEAVTFTGLLNLLNTYAKLAMPEKYHLPYSTIDDLHTNDTDDTFLNIWGNIVKASYFSYRHDYVKANKYVKKALHISEQSKLKTHALLAYLLLKKMYAAEGRKDLVTHTDGHIRNLLANNFNSDTKIMDILKNTA